jgi:hypothetical protein
MTKWRNRLLLAEIEATYGTAPAMTGTDAILVSEIEVTPIELDLQDRELITGYLGNTEKVIGAQMSKVTFSVEWAASGTAGTAPKWGRFLRACGFAETIVASTSVTYLPVSTAMESVAMRFYSGVGAGATEHLIRGARGTAELDFSAGEIPRVEFEFTGLYTAAAGATAPVATFSAQAKPLAFNSRNTNPVSVHGFAAVLEEFSLELENEVVFRQNAGGSENVQITDREPNGDLKIEAPLIGAKDFFAAVAAQTLGAVSFVHGTTAGNIITLSMPSVSFDGVEYSESDGITMLEIPYVANPTSAGNDEISIVFT